MAKKDNRKKSETVEKPDLAVHETIELHEVMTVKQASLMKSDLMESLVEDSKLRDLVRKEKKLSKKAIKELQELLP